MFPEIRGLMHIKNDTELQVFKESRSNILVALWSNQCKDLNKFLEVIDNLAH
jgi:thioredoxin-like negative regulator of GroEL